VLSHRPACCSSDGSVLRCEELDVEFDADVVGDDEAAGPERDVEVDAVVGATDCGGGLEAGVEGTVARKRLRTLEDDVEADTTRETYENLAKLSDLREAGVLTKKEYESKKDKMLGKL